MRDIGKRFGALCAGRVENFRTILRSRVGALAIQLGWIVRDQEINVQQLFERDLRGVEPNLDGLGMPGASRTYGFVLGGIGLAAGISGDDAIDAAQGFEDELHSPKTSAGE